MTTPADPSAYRERLVEKNLRLAYFHARRIAARRTGGLSVEDLEQEAVMGLMAAAATYDIQTHPDVPFSAYSREWILRYLRDAVERWDRIRLDPLVGELPDPSSDPRRERLALEVWDMLEHVPPRARKLLERRYGLDGSEPMGLLELADHFGLPARSVGRLLAVGRQVVRRECHLRGISFDRWATAIGEKIA